jgi:hypothetical protein
MLKTQQKSLSGHALRDAGWAALVSNLGLVNATRFIMQYETGQGDYTAIKKGILKGRRIADLYKETAMFEKKHL